MLKKILLSILGVLVLLVALAVVLPIIFKDDIKAKIDQEIAKSVNANVYFDADKFSISLFRNFPNASISMQDFGVVGKGDFEGDTLISVDDFNLVVDVKSILFGDKINLKGLELYSPKIMVLVLENGKANYDIMIPSDSIVSEAESSEDAGLSIAIDYWKIEDGRIVYLDDYYKFFMDLKGVNHTGSGDFTDNIFKMVSSTQTESFTTAYDGVEYVSDKKLDAEVEMSMDLDKWIFTFGDNSAKLNDFAFSFEGFFAMPEERFDMDMKFATKENSFKSLLSLVPGVYSESYEGLKAEGAVEFNGFVKGMYTDSLMPGFNLNLLVKDGNIQYPSLPTSVKNIQLDMTIDNPSGILDLTKVDIKNLHMDLGSNPIDAKVLINGLTIINVDANIKAKIDLAELNQIFPIDSLELKGIYTIDFRAKGTYDSVKAQIPNISSLMSLTNGYIKSAEIPFPVENLGFNSTITNNTGKFENTVIEVQDFKMKIENEPFEASMKVENLNDYTWNIVAKGGLNLKTITTIFPMEGMSLEGKISADFQTKGKMSDVDAGRYDKLPTQGGMSLTNFKYSAQDFPQGLSISKSELSMQSEKLILKSFEGIVGKSDLSMDGYLSNYIAYFIRENETLKGTLTVRSNKFDANEWMAEDSTASTSSSDTVPLTVIEIPKNIDFKFEANMKEVLYTNMSLTEVKGIAFVKDGMLNIQGISFNSLGGSFTVAGTYDTRNMDAPKFDMMLGIKDLAFKEAYKTFNTIKKLAPVAEKIDGNFSTDFRLNGLMAQDMTPNYSTLLGKGVIKVAQASLKDSKVISGVTSLTKMKDSDGLSLKDILVQAEVKDGRLYVKPFDVDISGNKTTVSGSNGIDGSLDYLLKMNVNAGAAGAAINGLISSIGGSSSNGSSVKLNLKVGGNYNDPKVSLASSEAGESTSSSAKAAVETKVNQEVDKAKAEAEKKAKAEADRLKKEAEAKAKAEAEKLKKKAKSKVKDLLKGGK